MPLVDESRIVSQEGMSDLEESKIVSHAISLGKEEDDELSKHEEEQKRKKLQGAELIEENMKEV